MAIITVDKYKYTAEPLYQWDLNQTLEIRGLSLPSIPEIHFHNAALGRAIVRQADMDEAGVVRVDIPNSLLQKAYPIAVYLCRYEGETFFSEYRVELEVRRRAQPSDYILVDDPEVYSFNALENQVVNALTRLESAIELAEDARKAFDEAKDTVDTAVSEAAQKAADQMLGSIKTDILDVDTKELFGLEEGADINDFAGKVRDLFTEQDEENARLEDLINSRVEQGSYVGTGTYGAENPCSLTFHSAPKLLFIGCNTDLGTGIHIYGEYGLFFVPRLTGEFTGGGYFTHAPNIGLVTNITAGGTAYSRVTETTVEWYYASSSQPAGYQLNKADVTYHYVALF